MKMFCATNYGSPKIKEIDLDRATASSVWIDGRRRARESEYEAYFDTWDEARKHLLFIYEKRVAQARSQLQYESDLLGNIKGMKKP